MTKPKTSKQIAQAAAGVKVTEDPKPALKHKPRAGRTTSGVMPVAPETKADPKKTTNPELVKVVKAHAEKNKDRNGWGKVLDWPKEKLCTLLAGAKTENAAIKRTRAEIDA